MEFHREKLIQNPSRVHRCEFCTKEITGRHWYVSCKVIDFFTYRAHEECYTKATEMCNRCKFAHSCESNISDCYNYTYINSKGCSNETQ